MIFRWTASPTRYTEKRNQSIDDSDSITTTTHRTIKSKRHRTRTGWWRLFPTNKNNKAPQESTTKKFQVASIISSNYSLDEILQSSSFSPDNKITRKTNSKPKDSSKITTPKTTTTTTNNNNPFEEKKNKQTRKQSLVNKNNKFQ
jgi:hypothetical protein